MERTKQNKTIIAYDCISSDLNDEFRREFGPSTSIIRDEQRHVIQKCVIVVVIVVT